MDEADSLREYVEHGSNDAFARLVRGHINLVYAAAVRQTRDHHLAHDVTQAVFMVLARKAHTIRNPGLLGAWLVRTTRYAAGNALRARARQQKHERKAAAMALAYTEADIHSLRHGDQKIASVLDAGMARLGKVDRSAIALRFLQGMSISAVGAALGLSSEAAQKRVSRALIKMRKFLAGQGIAAPQDALEATLHAQMLCTAPAALVSSVVAQTLGGSVNASGAASIARMTMKAASLAKASIAAAACMAGGLIAVVAVSSSTAPSAPAAAVATTTPATSTSPISSSPFPNVTFTLGGGNQDFALGIDPEVKHGENMAVVISSTTRKWGQNFGATRPIDVLPLRGKRIRFSAWVKSQDLANWGGIQLWGASIQRGLIIQDDLGDRPITGTTDWKQYAIVADIPDDTDRLVIGLHVHGAGHLWMDDARVEQVGADVATTDDQNWHTWSFSRPHYAINRDVTAVRQGHPTTRLSSDVAKNGEWFAYDHNDRHPDQYRGKKIRMTAWMKTENVTGGAALKVRVLNGNVQQLVTPTEPLVKGTSDWKQYEVVADVPEETQCICSGFRLNGRGKMWVDDPKYEVVVEGK